MIFIVVRKPRPFAALVVLDHARQLPKQLLPPMRCKFSTDELAALDKIVRTLRSHQVPPSHVKSPMPSKAKQLTRADSTCTKNSTPPSTRTAAVLALLDDEDFDDDLFGSDDDLFSNDDAMEILASDKAILPPSIIGNVRYHWIPRPPPSPPPRPARPHSPQRSFPFRI